MVMPAAKLPSVQKAKLETFKAASAAGEPAPVRTTPVGATAVASMTPGPRAAPVASGELDLNRFAVNADPAAPGEPAVGDPPVGDEPPRAKTAEEEEAERNKKWKAENPDLFHRYKTIAGMHEKLKSDHAELKAVVGELKEALDLLKKAQPAPAPTPLKVAGPIDEDLDEAERTTYATAVPVIAKVSKRVAQDIQEQIVAPLQARIDALEAKTGDLSTGQAVNEARDFASRVRDKVPGLDAQVKSPEWQEYLAKKAPFTNLTMGQALVDAHNARDFDTVMEIFNGFKTPEKPSADELATPGVSRVTQQPLVDKKKPILKWSLRAKAGEDMRKGRLPKPEFAEIEQAYKVAAAENRIDYNA